MASTTLHATLSFPRVKWAAVLDKGWQKGVDDVDPDGLVIGRKKKPDNVRLQIHQHLTRGTRSSLSCDDRKAFTSTQVTWEEATRGISFSWLWVNGEDHITCRTCRGTWRRRRRRRSRKGSRDLTSKIPDYDVLNINGCCYHQKLINVLAQSCERWQECRHQPPNDAAFMKCGSINQVSLGKGSRTNGPDRRGKVLRRCASASDWAGDEEDGQLADHLHHWGWQVQYTDEERGAPGEQDNAHESYAISSSSAYQKHGENERERRRRRRRHPDSPSVVCNQPPRGTEEWPEEAAGYDDGDDGSGPDEAYVDGLDADDVEIGLEEDEDRDAGDGANVCGEDDMTADMNEGDPEDGSGLPAKTPHMETNLEEEETDKKVDDSDPDENGSSLPAKTPEMGKEVEDEEENDKGDGNGDEEKEQIGVKAAVTLLRFYKREISPWIPGSCRYVPTCSEYAIEAYTRYGLAKGTVLTACRICRCNPLGGSGFDPPRWFGESKLQPPPPPPSPPPPPPSRL